MTIDIEAHGDYIDIMKIIDTFIFNTLVWLNRPTIQTGVVILALLATIYVTN